ncbi:hypothetical protein E2986_11977 [Frieseomelitta varia]|uniref:Uncharacterized protein n=1 Tax=Frieseomelitta varia TaxID=561572 RepID=A0A833RL31_9HYME|nr:hypothetical protein E2986_11977 [Frieseomelitta varia]
MIEVARNDRQIENWPSPYSSDMTEYRERDFQSLVRHSCKTKRVTLKIAKAIVIGDVSVGKSSLIE